jgi:hypothetical protein
MTPSAAYGTEWERRSACLRALVADAAQRGDAMLILEQDDTLIAADRKLLYRAARDERCPDLRYEHRAAAEQLLALPHAIAWCWAKGGDWQRRVLTANGCSTLPSAANCIRCELATVCTSSRLSAAISRLARGSGVSGGW